MKITVHLTDGTTKILGRPTSKCGDWSRERITLLRKLWQTALPSSEIARAISKLTGPTITKNACCNKARRLKLPPKPNAATDPIAAAFRSTIVKRSWESRRANGTDRPGTRANR